MWGRITFDDLRVVLHFIGIILLVVAATMLIPLVFALVNKEWDPALDFALSFGVTVFSGVLALFAKIRPGDLKVRQGLILTALTWIVVSLYGALPLYLSGHYMTYFDALFEAVSGFTTTGVTMVEDLDHLAYAHGLWRTITHVLGGQGILTFALGIGAFMRLSGASVLFRAEGKSDSVLPSIATSARFAGAVTLSAVVTGSVICALVCMSVGISPGRALYHGASLAATAFSLGGFSAMSTNVGYYHSFVLEVVLMVIMVAGALGFAAYFEYLRSGFKGLAKDIEMRSLLWWSVSVVILGATAFAYDPFFSDVVVMVRRGMFTVIAALCNTGFTMFHPAQISAAMGPGMLFVLIVAMSMGASASSPSGGIKALRIGLILRSIGADVVATLLPETSRPKITYHHLGRKTLSSHVVEQAMLICLLFIITYLAGGMLGVSLGIPPLTAVFESVSVTANAGMSAGVVNSAMPVALKVSYLLQMIAGRLEFLAFLVLLVGAVVSLGEAVRSRVSPKR